MQNQSELVAKHNWATSGSNSFVQDCVPVINDAIQTGDPENVLNVYCGILGAWWGTMVAGVGLDGARKIATVLFDGILKVDPTNSVDITH